MYSVHLSYIDFLSGFILTLHHSVLSDESVGEAGDLYIRSVRFSPDGKYLATGAEDRQIRVRMHLEEVDA